MVMDKRSEGGRQSTGYLNAILRADCIADVPVFQFVVQPIILTRSFAF